MVEYRNGLFEVTNNGEVIGIYDNWIMALACLADAHGLGMIVDVKC